MYVSSKAATQSFATFSLRRVLGGCSAVCFRAATQSFGLFSLRRVLWGLCRTVSQSRHRVSCRFSCVVSWVIAFLCGSVPRRRVLWRFLCVVSCGGSAVPFLNRDTEFLAVFLASCPGRVLCCVVPCHDAEFCDVFFASCLVWCSAVPFFNRDAKFRAVFPASCPI